MQTITYSSIQIKFDCKYCMHIAVIAFILIYFNYFPDVINHTVLQL